MKRVMGGEEHDRALSLCGDHVTGREGDEGEPRLSVGQRAAGYRLEGFSAKIQDVDQ
jgi:hypothetical protein